MVRSSAPSGHAGAGGHRHQLGSGFFEYCLQVPANRIGYGYFSAAELKTIQEVISLTIFGVFSTLYLGESLSWNHLVGFALIVGGAFFVFKGERAALPIRPRRNMERFRGTVEEPEARGGDNTEMDVPFSEPAAEGLVVEEVSRRAPTSRILCEPFSACKSG